MKGKRHTTEEKIRILREADGGESITSTQAKDYHSTWPNFRDPLRLTRYELCDTVAAIDRSDT